MSHAVSGEDIRVVSVAPGPSVDSMVHRVFLIPVSVAVLDQSLIEDE